MKHLSGFESFNEGKSSKIAGAAGIALAAQLVQVLTHINLIKIKKLRNMLFQLVGKLLSKIYNNVLEIVRLSIRRLQSLKTLRMLRIILTT